MTSPRLTLGSRGSPLALAQARMAAAAIEQVHNWPAGSVAIHVIKTSGDIIRDRPLAEIGGKALWTKELDAALLAGEIDASVHSMKDVESERPAALRIAAMLPRADVRDRLIGSESIADLPQGAIVGSSSPRRTAQLLRVRPDLRLVPIRGNVETRLAKLAAGEVDATLLAAAGLDRLGRGETGAAIPPEEMLPAPAQGAIGIECRTNGIMTSNLLEAIDDRATRAAVEAERAFARALGGNCYSPVAALGRIEEGKLRFDAEILSGNGRTYVARSENFAIGDLDEPAKLARAMLEAADPAIRSLFEGG